MIQRLLPTMLIAYYHKGLNQSQNLVHIKFRQPNVIFATIKLSFLYTYKYYIVNVEAHTY
jgi:hypothetical protein